MIAMQYQFTLPADYDMSSIKRLVEQKGHMLDNLESLSFKAYLIARINHKAHVHENQYAPFYLWLNNEGMRDYLCSAGFNDLCANFGRPVVQTWPCVFGVAESQSITEARFASRSIFPVVPYVTNMELFYQHQTEQVKRGLKESGALMSLAAMDPVNWNVVKLRLWDDSFRLSMDHQTQSYEVLHVSNPNPLPQLGD